MTKDLWAAAVDGVDPVVALATGRRIRTSACSGWRCRAAGFAAQEHDRADCRGHQEQNAAADPDVSQRNHEVIDEQSQVEGLFGGFGRGRRRLGWTGRRAKRSGQCLSGGRSWLDWRW